MANRIALIRAPFMYRYFDLDVREDSILTMLSGYFDAIGMKDYTVFDFHLNRKLTFENLMTTSFSSYVISIREVSDNVSYAKRLANAIRKETDAPILLYGESARLHCLKGFPKNIQIVRHNEHEIAQALQLSTNGPKFETGLLASSYLDSQQLTKWQRNRCKGSVETTRGCHFPCRFCFINSGDNYGARWQRRPVEAIVQDVSHYLERGVKSIVFHDAEFFGANYREYQWIKKLLTKFRDDLPDFRFMIYSRADTLLRFGDFDLLKTAGLANVFIGAESLEQSDLDSLNKKLKVEDILTCVQELKRHDIHMHLNFITFNRNSDVATIRTNLNLLEEVYDSSSMATGLPHFVFSFETDWNTEVDERTQLSDQTYVKWDLEMRAQPSVVQTFDSNLEPFVEMCRLLGYEWLKKVVEISHSTNSRSPYWILEQSETPNEQVTKWYQELPKFCIKVMKYFLTEFEQGRLNLSTLNSARDDLYDQVEQFYETLPVGMKNIATKECHGDHLSYESESELLEMDEYWTAQIPV